MKQNGFTLMELMITVAIVAILATVAIPSYSNYVQKSRRSEAFNALTSVINAMEKYRLSANAYPTSIGMLDTTITSHGLRLNGAIWESESGNYRLNIENDSTGNPAVRAVAQGDQIADRINCMTFFLSVVGRKRVYDSSSSGVDKSDSCWPS